MASDHVNRANTWLHRQRPNKIKRLLTQIAARLSLWLPWSSLPLQLSTPSGSPPTIQQRDELQEILSSSLGS